MLFYFPIVEFPSHDGRNLGNKAHGYLLLTLIVGMPVIAHVAGLRYHVVERVCHIDIFHAEGAFPEQTEGGFQIAAGGMGRDAEDFYSFIVAADGGDHFEISIDILLVGGDGGGGEVVEGRLSFYQFQL